MMFVKHITNLKFDVLVVGDDVMMVAAARDQPAILAGLKMIYLSADDKNYDDSLPT